MALSPRTTVTNPRIAKLIELEVSGRIKPEHQQELDTYRAQGLAPKAAAEAKPTEDQAKSASYYERATRANANFLAAGSEADSANADGMPSRGLLQAGVHAVVPALENTFISPARQKADQATREFVAATLRRDSGAAISSSEFATQYSTYFPQPGDSSETLKQKELAREGVIQGLKIGAGPLADKVAHSVAGEGPAALAEHLTDKAAGLQGQEAPPEAMPGGKIRVKAPDGSYSIFENQRAYDESVLERQSGGRDTPAFRAAYKAKFGEEPGIVVDVVGGRDMSQEELDKDRGGWLGNADAAVRGAADTVTFGLADEIAAAGDTIAGSGTMKQNLRYERGVDTTDERINPIARIGGQFAGALALPALGATTARGFAALGAGYGAGYGFGSTNGSIGDRIKGAGVGAALGGPVGFLGGTLAERMAARAAAAPPRLPPGGADAVALAHAGEQEGVALSRPVVDPSVRTRMAYLESSPGSGGPVRRALNATSDSIEARVGALGQQGGTAQEGGALGQRIQDAGTRFIGRSRDVRNRLYDRAAQMAGNAEVHPTEALSALDDHIAQLERNGNTNAPTLSYLREVRADLTSGAKTLSDIRDIRTNLRGNISQRNLMHTPAERIVGQVLDAARTDVQRDLGAAAPAAVRAYQRADRFNAERSAEIRQVVQRVIGRQDDRLGGEQVMSRIRSMAGPNGDSGRLARMIDKLSPEERADYTATVAASLGRRSPEEEFSPALFISSVRGMSPAARRNVFGPDGARSIENLRLLAEAQRDTLGSLNNSRSGAVLNWGNFLRNFAGGGGAGTAVAVSQGTTAGLATGAALSGVAVAARNLSARALMSPNMSRWLATAPRQNTPAAIAAHISRLTQIAARDPSISAEALGLQKTLLRAMNDNVPLSRAAASSPDGEKQQEQAK